MRWARWRRRPAWRRGSSTSRSPRPRRSSAATAPAASRWMHSAPAVFRANAECEASSSVHSSGIRSVDHEWRICILRGEPTGLNALPDVRRLRCAGAQRELHSCLGGETPAEILETSLKAFVIGVANLWRASRSSLATDVPVLIVPLSSFTFFVGQRSAKFGINQGYCAKFQGR
jgi:hypothetical protein